MEDQAIKLAAALATAVGKNTVNIISDRIKIAHANSSKDKTINTLEEIINDLQSDKNELIRISQAYEQEFVSQKITEKELKYITDNVLPLLDKFIPQNQKETVEQIKSVLSVETLNIMQLLGFNYKKAVGEPLTSLLQKTIESKIPIDPVMNQKFQLAIIELAKDSEALARYEILTGVKLK